MPSAGMMLNELRAAAIELLKTSQEDIDYDKLTIQDICSELRSHALVVGFDEVTQLEAEIVEGYEEIRSGNVYIWVGLPGQYDPEAKLIVTSVVLDGGLNCVQITPIGNINSRMQVGMGSFDQEAKERRDLVTIGMANFVTAVEQGWLQFSHNVDDGKIDVPGYEQEKDG